LDRLQDYYAKNGVLPPYSTIMGIVGMKSKSPVAALVARLKLQGYLESTPEKRSSRAGGSSSAPSSTVCAPDSPAQPVMRSMTC